MGGWRNYIGLGLMLAVLLAPTAGYSAAAKKLRIGYLDDPAAVLVVVAAARGLYEQLGIEVILVPFTDSKHGLEALERRRVEVGAFRVDETLKRIAAGANIAIIAGGGRAGYVDQVTELEDEVDAGAEISKGVVLSVSTHSNAPDKKQQIKVVRAVIGAYQVLAAEPKEQRQRAGAVSLRLDPNPNFWKLQQLWTYHGLQNEKMSRDFLARHVDEEIYCDALDELLDADGRKDPVLLRLNGRAVCVPDCCPTKNTKQK